MSGPAPKDMTKIRIIWGIGISAILHILVINYILISSSSKISEFEAKIDAFQDAPGIELDLTPVNAGFPKPQHIVNPLEQMMADATDDRPLNDLGQMSLDQPKPQASFNDVFGKDTPQQQVATKSRDSGKVSVAGKNNQPQNELWKAIEPCWKRMAPKDAVSVQLSLSFSPLGNLSKPPQIIRESGKPISDRLLRSESAAITAVSQCGPYLMSFGQQNVVVGFGAG